jgi:RNA polymerase-binding transcription factor DksA
MANETPNTGRETAAVDFDAARERLVAERERVEGLIEGLREEFVDSQREEYGELASVDGPADQGSETAEREKDLAILESFERELAEIEAALARIDDGTYGLDEITGEVIDPARLEALPTARTNIPPGNDRGGEPRIQQGP